MTNLDELLRRAIDDLPPLSITRESSLAAGRRALRRRRTLVVGACAGFLLIAGAAASMFGGAGRTPPSGPSAIGVPTYPVPQLPAAVGIPGALQRPDLVGSDPLVRHFSLDTSAWPVGDVVYSSTGGSESIFAGALMVTVSRLQSSAEQIVDAAPRRTALVTGTSPSAHPRSVAASPSAIPGTQSRKPTTVGGRPATLVSTTYPDGRYPVFGLVWQPVDGLWVGMLTQTQTGEAELWSDVAVLHLDRAQRCVVPFRLTDLPSGATVLGCTAGVPAQGEKYAYSDILIGDRHGNQADVEIGQIARPAVVSEGSSPAPLPTPNRTINGRAVLWSSTGPTGFLSDDFNGVPLALAVQGSYGEAEATRILAGLQMSADLTDPTTWPSSPIAR